MEYLTSFHSRSEFLSGDTPSDMGMVMGGNYSPPLTTTAEASFSTGSLEDALMETSQQWKRRRLIFHSYDQNIRSDDQNLQMSFWRSNFNLGFNGFSDDEQMSQSVSRILSEMKASDDEEDPDDDDEPPTIGLISDRKSPFSTNLVSLSDKVEKKKKKMAGGGGRRRVVYPFAVVKPGGVDGEVTLKEINDRILMPPTRPVRHPVGDFACRPCVYSAGVGLSGKAVVALTRIQTNGRGTITIIRTKG